MDHKNFLIKVFSLYIYIRSNLYKPNSDPNWALSKEYIIFIYIIYSLLNVQYGSLLGPRGLLLVIYNLFVFHKNGKCGFFVKCFAFFIFFYYGLKAFVIGEVQINNIFIYKPFPVILCFFFM